MLKNYLQEKGISIYSLSKESGIPYSTLNDLVNGKVLIDNCRVSLARSLSSVLGLSMDDLCDLCSGGSRSVSNSYNTEARLFVRAKYYHIRFTYNDAPVDLKLCKVNEDNSFYIEDIARWRIEDYLRKHRMQEFR